MPSFSLRRIVSVLSFTYSLLILTWLGLRWLSFDQFWPLAIINTTIFFFFLPLPILLILAVHFRLKRAIVALVLPATVLVYFWGPLFLPTSQSTIEKSTRHLTAMSYNVLFSNKTPDELVASIDSASPDIVGLQELAPHLIDSLKSDLQVDYPYHTFDLFEPRGVGLLSRYPIVSATKFYFPPRDRLALHTIIDWRGQSVHVFVVHLSANNFFDNPVTQLPELAIERYSHRANQITSLLEQLSVIEGPVILMCDCNFTDTSEAYYRLNQELNDSYRSVGWGFGHTLHPDDFPFRVQRIDYVWHNDDFLPLTSYVGMDGGSDHHPVISTLMHNSEE